MIEALGFLWLRPWWLVAVPVAALLALFLWRRSGGLGAWERAADPTLLHHLRAMGHVTAAQRGRALAAPALIALAGIALAGPASERRDAPTFRNLDGIVIIFDISPSMTRGSRFADAQAAARLLTQHAGARRAALVVYSGEAWLAAAFTTDAAALGGTLSLLAEDTAPIPGTRPAEGLRRALRALDDAAIIAADVVLISDGGGIDTAAHGAASALRGRGALVSTLHAGDPVDAPAMASLAATGGGVAGTLVDPFIVANALSGSPTRRLAETGFAAAVALDLGRWLLFLALIPAALILPRRRHG